MLRRTAGGLWLMWNDELKVTVHSSSFHYILANVIHVASGVNFCLICIYGDPYHKQTEVIWDQVAAFVYDNLGKPMVCMGDLNDILYDIDGCNGNINYYRMHAFRSLVKNCGLFDIGYSGPAYTWRGRHNTSKPVLRRLDRCLVNSHWCSFYPNTKVLNLPIILSDHAPILISTDGNFVKPRQTFKFENWWLMEQDFHSFTKNIWSNASHTSFAAKSSYLAGSLKAWCKKKKPLQNELALLEAKINELQQLPLQHQNQDMQCSLTARYELTLTKINQYYKQRSKKNWVAKGDRNTKFFHQAVIKRRKRNTICSIKDEHDLVHCNPTAIMQTFMNYFKCIFSSPNDNMTRPFPHLQGYNDNNDPTYSIPDNAEILQILKDMKLNASPGPDGFNVEFYLATWDWIGEEVTKLVTTFYQTATLPSHLLYLNS